MAEGYGHGEQQAAGGPAAWDGKTRRRVLAAAAGVLEAAAAEVAGSAAPAQADNGQAVLQGIDNTGTTHRTAVFTTSGEVARLADPGNSAVGSVGVTVPNVTGHSFTVYLSKAPSATAKVAWFVVN